MTPVKCYHNFTDERRSHPSTSPLSSNERMPLLTRSTTTLSDNSASSKDSRTAKWVYRTWNDFSSSSKDTQASPPRPSANINQHHSVARGPCSWPPASTYSVNPADVAADEQAEADKVALPRRSVSSSLIALKSKIGTSNSGASRRVGVLSYGILGPHIFMPPPKDDDLEMQASDSDDFEDVRPVKKSIRQRINDKMSCKLDRFLILALMALLTVFFYCAIRIYREEGVPNWT